MNGDTTGIDYTVPNFRHPDPQNETVIGLVTPAPQTPVDAETDDLYGKPLPMH